MRRTYIVGILISLPFILGCADKKSEKEQFDSQIDKEFSAIIEAFKNRPIYEQLTQKIIDTTLDEDLVQVIFDNLSTKIPEDYSKEFETVISWNEARKTIYIIWLLEAEVNNGGFNQFYYNSSGEFYEFVPQALLNVKAYQFADLTTRANRIYEKEKKAITEKQDGSIEGFSESYENNPLNTFDDEFYALYRKENLTELQIKYIRENSIEFVD